MKQQDKIIIRLLLIFSIIAIISCKKEVTTKNVSDINLPLKKNKQIDDCLQKKDSITINFFVNSLITDLKKDVNLANNHFHKEYENPDIIALENLNKYKITSIDINFERNNENEKCDEVYINFIVLTEIFTDDEKENHNVENSITLKVKNVKSEIKIIKIFVSG